MNIRCATCEKRKDVNNDDIFVWTGRENIDSKIIATVCCKGCEEGMIKKVPLKTMCIECNKEVLECSYSNYSITGLCRICCDLPTRKNVVSHFSFCTDTCFDKWTKKKNVKVTHSCSNCGIVQETMSKCAKCGVARYCSRRCQIDNWYIHKLVCGK